MISLDDALDRLLSACPEPCSEILPLGEAVGRILREDLVAQVNRPAQDRAAMDGYALRRSDLERSRDFRCVRRAYAGDLLTEPIAPMEAVVVSTGSSMPPGCDTVVRKEFVTPGQDAMFVHTLPEPGQDIRRKCEEWQKGETLAAAGLPVCPALIAVAAANGRTSLAVQRRPEVVVLSTGNEVAGGAADFVPDSNGPFLQAFCCARGVKARLAEPLADDPNKLAQGILSALDKADLLITSGGMSVGDRDHMRRCVASLGGELLFQGVKVRPGRPLSAARVKQRLWLMLPGSPGAVAMGAELFLAPLLFAMGAVQAPSPVQRPARGSESLGHFARLHWVKAPPGGSWDIQNSTPLNPHHLLSPLRSDGYILQKPQRETSARDVGAHPRMVPRGPNAIAITGPSGSGKTTLIRRLLATLGNTHRVVVLKHSHHPVPPEPPHKDTARFLAAGAQAVLFVSGSDLVLRSSEPPFERSALSRWVAQLEPAAQLIIIEGFSAFPGPRIEVLGPQDPRQPQALVADSDLLACVLRGREIPKHVSMPIFDSEDISGVARFLLESDVASP